MLLFSARCVTFHLCSEGQPVGANLTRQSVATDKVRGYLVQPFARRIQLCQHFRLDRARHFTHLVHSCRTRLWDLHTFRERNFHEQAQRILASALGCEASATVIGLCANGVLRNERKSIVREITVTSGIDSEQFTSCCSLKVNRLPVAIHSEGRSESHTCKQMCSHPLVCRAYSVSTKRPREGSLKNCKC